MKQKIPSSKSILLLPIVLLAILLRFVLLDKFPPSLNWDEVSHGYNAYSILKTGKDEWGKMFPIANFRAYGDYPLPLNLYITIPSILFFGLNEFSIRFPHAILGVLTVIATYYFACGLTKKKNVGLLASLLVAIDPWTVFTSRFVLQSNLSVFLLTTSAALFFNREKAKAFLPLSIISLGLTLYSYHTTRIFSPLLLLALLIIYFVRNKLVNKNELISTAKKTKLVVNITLLLLFFAPLPFIFAKPEARARSNMIFLIDEGAKSKIIESRNNSKFSPLIARFIFNRPTYFIYNFSKNYLDYFSSDFLFFNGGTQYQFSIPNTGLLYLVNMPFFFLGLFILVKKARTDKNYQLILSWLLLSPIPASITQERYAVLRSTTMLPLPEIISALGFFAVLVWLKTKRKLKIFETLLIVIYFICLAYGLEKYLTNYVAEYPKNYSWVWQYGYKEVANYTKDNYSKYDKIIITKKYGEPHEFILFYQKWNPESFRNDPNLIRFGQSNWFWVDAFDKYYFVNDWQVKEMKLESGGEIDCSKSKCLLVTSPGNVPANWRKLKDIDFLDGKPAFEMYANSQ